MKTSILKVASFLGLVVFMTSCDNNGVCIKGNGDIVTETFDLESFDAIDLQESANVKIIHGTEQRVQVTGDENIVDKLKKTVSQDRWSIALPNGCYKQYDLSIEITLPSVRAIELSGSGNVEVKNFNSSDDLDLSISGSGDIELIGFDKIDQVEARISGSGSIIATNGNTQVEDLDIRISGSGDVDVYALESDDCTIKISGSGNSYVTVQDALNVNISGSGKVYYHGNPVVTKNISGSGAVKKRD